MPTTPVSERELSAFEKIVWLNDKLCTMNFILYAEIQGELSVKSLRSAIDAVQLRHHLLKVKIVRQGWSGAKFAADAVAAIPLIVKDAPQAALGELAEAEMNKKFAPETGPLLRCLYLRHAPGDATLILILHHAIADAMSGVYLIRDIIQTVMQIDKGEPVTLSPLPPGPSLQARLPQWAQGVPGLKEYFKSVLRLAVSTVKWGRLSLPQRTGWDRPEKRHACIVRREIQADLTPKLIALSHAHNTTVHGALAAAAAIAMAELSDVESSVPILLGSDVDMRKRLDPPIGEEVGLFISGYLQVNRIDSKKDFWPLAGEIRATLEKGFELKEHFITLPLLMETNSFIFRPFGSGALGNWICARFFDMNCPVGLVMSNIGKITIETSFGDLEIQKIGVASSLTTLGRFAFFAATLNNILTWNFVGMEPLYSRAFTENVADRAIEVLLRNLS